MELVIAISVAVIAVVMLATAVVVLSVAARVRSAAREVERLADTARLQIAPVTHDLTVISQEARKILETIRGQVERVDEGVSALRDTAIRVRDFEQQLERRIEEPLLEIAALLSALARGVEAFYKVLRR